MPMSRAIAAPSLTLPRSRGRGGWGPAEHGAALSIGLSAVIVAASVHEPRVLTIRLGGGRGDGEAVEALPSGPLEAEHRTLEIGLRTWVERQTSQRLGYVEQLYTFGDREDGEDRGGRLQADLHIAGELHAGHQQGYGKRQQQQRRQEDQGVQPAFVDDGFARLQHP